MHAIFACEKQEQCDPYRQILINCGVDCGAEDAVVYGDLAPRINRGGAELLVVLLGAEPHGGLRLIQAVHDKGALPIIALGPSHDAQIIMQAMNAGAREYLDIDLPRESLAKSLEKLRQVGVIQFRRGQCIAVTGAAPGSGVTTVASGLAFALAAKHPKQVFLTEIGSDVPELALDLDLQVRNSVSQLLHDWERVDSSAVRQAAVEHAAGVYVLADANVGPHPKSAGADAGRQLIALVRTMYDFAVYDVGHAAQAGAQQAIRMADRVVLVVRLDVPSLRLTRALLNNLMDWGVTQQHLTLVANRYGQRGQINWKTVEEALGLPIAVWLPDDSATLNQALNLGVPVIEASRWSKLNRRFGELAAKIIEAVKK